MKNELKLNGHGLEEALWQTAGSAQFSPACERSLRAWITIGIQRMERQRRLAPEDLALAHRNLRMFVDFLKKESVFLDKPNQLEKGAFDAARRRLRRHASLTSFTLWPFWPHNFVLRRTSLYLAQEL